MYLAARRAAVRETVDFSRHVIHLDVPVSLSEKRINQRKADNYLDKESVKVQEQRKKYFDYLSDLKSENNHMVRIACTDFGSKKSVDQIGGEILNLIRENEGKERRSR